MLFEPLFVHAQSQPDAIAIIDDKGKYTYKQLSAAVAGLGLYLSMQTEKPRVGLLLPAGAGFVASFYGTLLAGKTVVPINFLLGDKEVAHIVKDSGIDTVVTIPQLAGRLKDMGLNVIDLTQLPQKPPFEITPTFPSPAPDDVAVLLYTSGTSGLPKGVLLTYGNFQSDMDAAITHARLKHQHVFLGVIPLFHSFGITAMMLAPIQLGATIIYMARFSPVGALHAIREHHVSLMFGVPSMYAAIVRLKDAKPEDFKSIYAMISGGEPLPQSLREAFKQRYGVALYEGYGLTETSPVVTLNIPEDNKPGSVGRPVPGAHIAIVDDNGAALPQGQIGEIWLKGPMIMKGYNNLPKETAEALTSDGYFKTGDLGMIDPEGYLHITGRKKDMIIVAGEKAYPREIEDTLMAHPAVAEAAVVGKKDPGRGEVIAAFVIAREGQTVKPDELRDFCRQHGLAQWKIPRDIQIVPDFPRNPTGKVLKRELVEKLAS
ncbi:MAG TPA: AMP-binding protein [Tepidisphaeraceae bacterium]|jgi:long-chain acyl-CoA synthetase|nr:AMP-binding protein [Tepidisphaeraceae bacterium]